jgi:hypothetical protein
VKLAELLGVDPATFEWQQLSLCKNLQLTAKNDIFFDKYEQDIEVAKATDAMCLSCPVQKMCLRTGLENGETGVWGGVFLEGRKASVLRNQHKTKEVWDAIKKSVND